MQNAVGLSHLLLQQFQLLPRAAIGGRKHQIQIIGAGIDHAERLAEVVNQAADHGPSARLERIGEGSGNFGSECEHIYGARGVTTIIPQV